jgi:hypothetical protein
MRRTSFKRMRVVGEQGNIHIQGEPPKETMTGEHAKEIEMGEVQRGSSQPVNLGKGEASRLIWLNSGRRRHEYVPDVCIDTVYILMPTESIRHGLRALKERLGRPWGKASCPGIRPLEVTLYPPTR